MEVLSEQLISLIIKVTKLSDEHQRLADHPESFWTEWLDRIHDEQQELIDRASVYIAEGMTDPVLPTITSTPSSAPTVARLKLKKLDYAQFSGSFKNYAKWRRDYDLMVLPENPDEASRATILRS